MHNIRLYLRDITSIISKKEGLGAFPVSSNEEGSNFQKLCPRGDKKFARVHQGVLDKDVVLLQKPFTPSALARKVREVLDQQAQRSSEPA